MARVEPEPIFPCCHSKEEPRCTEPEFILGHQEGVPQRQSWQESEADSEVSLSPFHDLCDPEPRVGCNMGKENRKIRKEIMAVRPRLPGREGPAQLLGGREVLGEVSATGRPLKAQL